MNTRVVDDGEIAVDSEAAQVAILGGERGDGTFGQKPARRELPSGTGKLAPSQKTDISQTRVHLPEDVNSSTNLEFSPDGTKMVYFSLESPSTPHGLIVRPVVTVSPNVPPRTTVLLAEGPPTIYYQPKWSPDGRWIAFYRHSPSTGRSPGSGEDYGRVYDFLRQAADLHFSNANRFQQVIQRG